MFIQQLQDIFISYFYTVRPLDSCAGVKSVPFMHQNRGGNSGNRY